MPAVDQTGMQFIGQLRNGVRGFLDWINQEGAEREHMQPGDVNEPPTYPRQAAGTLLMAPDGRALFMRRSGVGDHGGEWSLPGGMAEGDEMPWQTALRETKEEVGDCGIDEGSLALLDHNVTPQVGFTTYGARVDNAFAPIMDREHDQYQWSHLRNPPEPLHDGLRATLDFALDPLTDKGEKIMSAMKKQYGPEKGEQVFYASANKGNITGVHDNMPPAPPSNLSVAVPRDQLQGTAPASTPIAQTEGFTPFGQQTTDCDWQIGDWGRVSQPPRQHRSLHNVKPWANPQKLEPKGDQSVGLPANAGVPMARRQSNRDQATPPAYAGHATARRTTRDQDLPGSPSERTTRDQGGWPTGGTLGPSAKGVSGGDWTQKIPVASDPPVSEAQRRAMGAAMGGKSQLGISPSVGKEFIEKDPGGSLPEKKGDNFDWGNPNWDWSQTSKRVYNDGSYDQTTFKITPKPLKPPPSRMQALGAQNITAKGGDAPPVAPAPTPPKFPGQQMRSWDMGRFPSTDGAKDFGTSEGARKAAQSRGPGGGQAEAMGEFRKAMGEQQRKPGLVNFARMLGKSLKVNPTQHVSMEKAVDYGTVEGARKRASGGVTTKPATPKPAVGATKSEFSPGFHSAVGNLITMHKAGKLSNEQFGKLVHQLAAHERGEAT